MLLKLRPSGLGSGIDKGRQDYETREGPEKHLRWFRSFAVQGHHPQGQRLVERRIIHDDARKALAWAACLVSLRSARGLH